jgi:hypothetical protein
MQNPKIEPRRYGCLLTWYIIKICCKVWMNLWNETFSFNEKCHSDTIGMNAREDDSCISLSKPLDIPMQRSSTNCLQSVFITAISLPSPWNLFDFSDISLSYSHTETSAMEMTKVWQLSYRETVIRYLEYRKFCILKPKVISIWAEAVSLRGQRSRYKLNNYLRNNINLNECLLSSTYINSVRTSQEAQYISVLQPGTLTTRPQRRSTFFYITYINSVRTSQESQYISVL